jgi:cyclohexa-1,5-dienecarbonyl-CoA hydratase
VAAARADFCHRLDQRLAEVERFYLDGLMSSHDAAEGIAAFIAKRPVEWKNR